MAWNWGFFARERSKANEMVRFTRDGGTGFELAPAQAITTVAVDNSQDLTGMYSRVCYIAPRNEQKESR